MMETLDAELDRLDKIVAEAMGWPTVKHQRDVGAIDGPCICLNRNCARAASGPVDIRGPDGNWCWSPTRNANHRDEVVEWLRKNGRAPMLMGWPECYEINLSVNFPNLHPYSFSTRGPNPGEAVCKAVEELMKGNFQPLAAEHCRQAIKKLRSPTK